MSTCENFPKDISNRTLRSDAIILKLSATCLKRNAFSGVYPMGEPLLQNSSNLVQFGLSFFGLDFRTQKCRCVEERSVQRPSVPVMETASDLVLLSIMEFSSSIPTQRLRCGRSARPASQPAGQPTTLTLTD